MPLQPGRLGLRKRRSTPYLPAAQEKAIMEIAREAADKVGLTGPQRGSLVSAISRSLRAGLSYDWEQDTSLAFRELSGNGLKDAKDR
jgi:hypothetical protein